MRYYPAYHQVGRPNPAEGVRLRKFYMYTSREGIVDCLAALGDDFGKPGMEEKLHAYLQKGSRMMPFNGAKLDDIAVAVAEQPVTPNSVFELNFIANQGLNEEDNIYEYLDRVLPNGHFLGLGYGAHNNKLQSVVYPFGASFPLFSLLVVDASTPEGFSGGPVFNTVNNKAFAIIVGHLDRDSNIRLITQMDMEKLVMPALQSQENLPAEGVEVNKFSLSR